MLLWRNSPSIIVGRFQNTAAEVNEPFVRKTIFTSFAASPEGAVYHDLGNLNYTFAVPNDSDNPSIFKALPADRRCAAKPWGIC